jgi:hypothetical protein
MIKPMIHQFDEVGPNDPVRILEVWERHERVTNLKSALMLVFTGFPVKKIEQYSVGLHRIGFSAAELARPN